MKVIDNIIGEHEPILHHNDKDKTMYGAITEDCDDAKKVIKEVLSLLKGNGI